MKINIWTITTAIFLIWAIGATVTTSSYYTLSQNQQAIIESLQSIVSNVAIKVNIAISYGNGTVKWYNDTYLPVGSPLFNATAKLCKVEFTVYPSLGIWVNSINGVSEDPTAKKYWIWYTWLSNSWSMGPVGADQYVLRNGETIKWELIKF